MKKNPLIAAAEKAPLTSSPRGTKSWHERLDPELRRHVIEWIDRWNDGHMQDKFPTATLAAEFVATFLPFPLSRMTIT